MLALFLREIFETFRDPRGFARRVLLPRQQSLQASFNMAALAVVLNMLQMAALLLVGGAGLENQIAEVGEPAGRAALQDAAEISLSFRDLVLIAGGAALAQFALVSAGGALVGQLSGGHGSFRQVSAVVAWHSLCLVVGSIVVSAMELLLGPSLAGIAAAMLLIYGFWMLASLIGEAHGFERTGIVLIGIFACIAVFAMAGGMMLSLSGIAVGAG